MLPNVQRETLHAIIHKNVEPGSTVYTDAWKAYRQLEPTFVHDFVDHTEAYVKDKVIHTNGLENFWRCSNGAFVEHTFNVEPFHLFRYVDSEAYRFNNRKTDDSSRFVGALPGRFGQATGLSDLDRQK